MGCSQSTKVNDLITGITITQKIEFEPPYVVSLVETEDKRIAVGLPRNIVILSFNKNEKKWETDILKENAHEGAAVCFLCNFKGKRLVSGGCEDYLIKIWKLSDEDLTLIKEIEAHTSHLEMVIPLSKDRFGSCGNDNSVKIWKDDDTYKCISILEHNSRVNSLVQLKGKEVLASSYDDSDDYPSGITFWDLNNYNKIHTIDGHYAYFPTSMIALPDGNIAVSSGNKPHPIVIIDSSTYEVKKEIHLKEYNSWSSLCVFNEHSFIYADNGTFIQISNEDYSILFRSDGDRDDFNGGRGIVPVEGGKYCAISAGERLCIVNLCYG